MTGETSKKKRPYKIDPDVARVRARLGGLSRAASQTAEQRQELGKHAAAAKKAARIARGEQPAGPSKPTAESKMTAAVLDYWRGVVRAEQPARAFSSAQELKRAAVLRARQEQARSMLGHVKERHAEALRAEEVARRQPPPIRDDPYNEDGLA